MFFTIYINYNPQLIIFSNFKASTAISVIHSITMKDRQMQAFKAAGAYDSPRKYFSNGPLPWFSAITELQDHPGASRVNELCEWEPLGTWP